MFSTPASLLDRLCKREEPTVWDRFVELYSPLLFHWAKRLGQQDSDAADLVQDAFLLLWRKLPDFEYDPSRSFHAWLKTLFINQHRLRLRKRLPLALNDAGHDMPADDGEDHFDELEYRQYLVQRAFSLIEKEFSPLHQKAFREYAIAERPPEEVARELGIRTGTVYGVKSKILSRLRQELGDLLD